MAVTVLPLCGVIFSCGCTLAEGARHCNVHHATGPRCPWCAGGMAAFLGSFGAIWALTCVTVGAVVLRYRAGYVLTLVAGVVGYGVWSAVVGLVVAVMSGYPTWFGVRLPV